jgi:hypothetical protein
MPQRMTVFVSYSHRDQQWLDRLQVHLRPLVRRGDLALWADTQLDPGDRWRASIREAIDHAAASVLLVSADFLASDFVVSDELPPLLRRAERAGTRIIPVIVAPCRLASYPELACFQAVNPPSAPLNKMRDAEAEDVFVRVAEVVDAVLSSARCATRADGVADGVGPAHMRASEDVFRDLLTASVATAILLELAAHPGVGSSYSLSDLTRTLDISSRKLSYDVVERMLKAKWIDKERVDGRTAYAIASEGVRQLQRLAAATDGPVRRAVAAR